MVEVPASSRGPGIARDVLTDALHAWHHSDLGDDAALIATELITNAVQHAPPADIVELELTLTDDVLRISVVDGSAVHPLITEMTEDRPTGRGMRIVEALADRWGADAYRDGKRVWAELSRAPGIAEPPETAESSWR